MLPACGFVVLTSVFLLFLRGNLKILLQSIPVPQPYPTLLCELPRVFCKEIVGDYNAGVAVVELHSADNLLYGTDTYLPLVALGLDNETVGFSSADEVNAEIVGFLGELYGIPLLFEVGLEKFLKLDARHVIYGVERAVKVPSFPHPLSNQAND